MVDDLHRCLLQSGAAKLRSATDGICNVRRLLVSCDLCPPSRETVALYVKVFEKLKQLVPLVPTTAIVGPLSIVQLSTANLHFSDYNSLHSYKRTIMDRCFVDVLVSMNRLYFGDIGLLECYHHCSNSYYRLLVIISG